MTMPQKKSQSIISHWQKWIVSKIYATHNTSPMIQKSLNSCLENLHATSVGLNVGSGDTRLHSSIINLDIQYSPSIDCFGKAEYIPFKDSSFTFVMTQETLEHVQKPYLAIEEMYRVLQKQGILYCQLPFIIGYHPGPTDFWRFSKEGICELVEQAGFIVEEVAIAVGPATGFYRIAVEFLAVIMSRLEPRAYRLSKGLMAVGLYPVKWLDTFLIRSEQADRIPGGYYVIARKPDQ